MNRCFGKTSERAVKESRERSAEQLFNDLECVGMEEQHRNCCTASDAHQRYRGHSEVKRQESAASVVTDVEKRVNNG